VKKPIHPVRTAGVRQAGVSMIEVLIALLVVSFAFVSVAMLQTSAIQNNHTSNQYTVAATVAQGLSEAMRANSQAVVGNSYNLAPGTAPGNPSRNCAAEVCTPAERAQWDLAGTYRALVKNTNYGNAPTGPDGLLPGAVFGVACADAAAACNELSPRVISVFWDGGRTGATGLNCMPADPADLNCFRLVHIP
jgi:type IV pilus assembly protein PilV